MLDIVLSSTDHLIFGWLMLKTPWNQVYLKQYISLEGPA